MNPAAKTETVLPLAVFFQLTENPHLGHQLPSAALYPGITIANSNTASGLRVCLYDSGRRSRSTGQERDSAQGRFLSPDPLGNFVATAADPQSWNMYAYARNNPLTLIDPTGLCSQDSDGNFFDDNPDGATFLYDGNCNVDDGAVQNGAASSVTVSDQEEELDTYEAQIDNFGNVSFSVDAFGNPLPGQTSSPLAPRRSSTSTYGDCVKNSGNFFSLQSAVQSVTGGRYGNSAIAGAFLGNPFSDIIGAGQSFLSGKANGSGALVLDAGAYKSGDAGLFVASKVPNFSGSIAIAGGIAVSTPTLNATVQIGGSLSGSLPLGSAALSLATGSAKFGNVLNLYNAGVTAVMAMVCGIY